MAIKRRKNKLQDLAASGIVTNRVSGSIPFEYEGPNSPLFTISEIPPSVPQGKSSFLIAGTELLKNSIEVKIEIIDSEGGVIYTEPVANYLEGNARRVSIEVYDDTPPGPANLYVLAQVDPEEWEDETGTDVTNFPSPRPLRPKGKRRKKRRRDREKRKQMRGMPVFDVPRRGGGGRFFVNPNFRPPPGNDTRFRRRRGRRRRGTTSDISDQYNFIQKVQMQIVPTATNTEKILFYQEPRLRVFEAFKPFVSNIAPSASITSTGFGITGTVIQDTQGSAAASSLDTFGAAINTFRKKRKFRKFAVKGGLSKRKRITRRASPEVDNYSLNVGNNFNFTSEHVGADLTLTNISVDQNEFPASRFKADSSGTEVANSTASFEVRKVKNSFTIIPDKSFQLFDNQLSQLVDAPLTNASFSLEFPNPVTQSISITNFRSYADVRVSNIRTFSGDVFRAKIYRKSEESISDYELFADLPLESSELLLNKNEGTGLERTGYFVTQSDAVDYWEVSQSYQGLTGLAATASAKYDIDKIMDAIHISGSNYEENNFVKFTLKKSHSFILEKDVDYDFSAEIYGIAKPKIVTPEEGPAVTKSMAEMEVFISGSNIPAQQGNEPFGAKIGALRINDGSLEKDFGIVTGDFESTANSSNCIITFKVNAGQFYLSDLSIRPATETGFSPDLFTFQAPMPENEQRPETYEFLAEFYDVNNNQADAFAFTPSGSVFQGSNMVIGGGDNVMESNLFIGGETTASGMHLGGVKSTVPEQGGVSGAEGSAFMRSVGYTGFTSASVAGKGGKPGFMFYSGSILPSSGDNYKGVGLELVGESGSLRFGTNPSRFEVKADAFFVGRRHQDSSTGIGQFISGALGNVEISSSNFHLTRAGDVTMQGTITATAGAIGGFGISAQTISSSNNNLILRSTGEITGSEVFFTGGKIASFEISDSVLKNGNNFFISGSATGNQFFISSSNFNVKASGDITGSDVKFTGGKIANWDIVDNKLQSLNPSNKGILFDADPSTPIIEIRENDDNRIQIYHTSNTNWGIIGKTGGNTLFRLGNTNEIAGWTIGTQTLTGGNLILDKDGSIRSSNYVTDFSGWIISAEDNGFAEFENVKVRGTLATTTFEKESVNAVGGQLFVANSTTITGSAVSAGATTMSVENMSGFADGEVLIAKKVTNTGFTTEYIRVNSASFDGDVSKDEFYGRIMVTRGIGTSPDPGTDSGSVGDTAQTAVSYEPGQVLCSTGKIGTGYIRLNANPNNQATPYIDIVERTGSNPYDVELKARLGDLSGVAGTRNVPANFDGFGLMTEVAFLSGSNIKLEAPAFILGDQNKTFVSGSLGNIEISSSAFHLKQDGQLLFGDKAGGKYVEWDNSNLVVRGDLAVDNIRTPSTILGNPSTFANASSSINSDGGAFFKSGSIAGFEFTPTSISKNSMLLESTGNVTLGTSNDVVRLSASDTTYRLWVGNATAGSAPFRVDKDGGFVATSATVTGTINAEAGNFSGDITSGATITGGTLRTADETVGAGKSVKINGSSNTLEFFGDAAAFNSNATDIPTKLFFLDDSNQLIEGNNYSDFPGVGFIGFDAQASTYDNATDNGTLAAMAHGGLYVPYNYGKGYTQFNSMFTGHAIGLYRGARGETKLSADTTERYTSPTTGNDYDYYYDTPGVYEVAQLKLIQSNGSPSARHSQDGNPTGFGGQSSFGDGGNHHIFTIQATNVLSRSNIADNSRNTDGSGYKVARSVSAGNNFRHGSTNGGGYNYFDHMELVGGDFHNTANDQVEQGFSQSKWYQWKFSGASEKVISVSSEDDITYQELASSFGSSNIDTANDGGSGHPSIDMTSESVTVSPANYSKDDWSTVEYIGYRIKIDDFSASGDPSMMGVRLAIRVCWNNQSGQKVKDIPLTSGNFASLVGGDVVKTHTGNLDCRGIANKWSSDKDHDIKIYLKVEFQGSGGTTLDIDNAGGSADTYVYGYGQGNRTTRVDNTDFIGTRISGYASGSGNVMYGVKNDSFFGKHNYGFYSRIRSAGTVYGVYSRVNETGTFYNLHSAKNGQIPSADVYAGYFLGNLHVAGDITYSGDINDTSDIRLKENIRIASGSLNLIKQLKTKHFDWKSDYEYEIGPHREGRKNDIGFIAQDVEKIDGLSNLIVEGSLPKRGYDPDKLDTHHPDYKDKTYNDFHKNFKFMNYEKLIPHLVNAMQEQQEQIEDLKKEIEELKQ